MTKLSAGGIWLAIVLLQTPVRAEVEAQSADQSSVHQLAEEYQENKKTIVEAESQKRKILGSLYNINKRMKKITREKGHLTDELINVQGNVQNIAKVITGLEQQIAEQRTRLRTRLRALYKLSGEGYVAMIFSSTSSNEMDQTLKYLKIVTDADYRLIRSYQKNVAAYKEQRNKLKGQVARLVTIEKAIRSQEDQLVSEHRAKTKIISNLDTSRTQAMKSIKKIRSQTKYLKETDAIENEVADGLLRASFFEKKGKLPHPVDGAVIQDFGLARDQHYKIGLSHKGWRYRSTAGAAVSAVFEGVVVHSSWIVGYGNLIIIDHGDHYYTVYGYVANPKVHQGESVSSGQTIAEVADGVRMDGDGVYFEVRHFSEPENPQNWLRRREIPVSSVVEESPIGLATSPYWEHNEN